MQASKPNSFFPRKVAGIHMHCAAVSVADLRSEEQLHMCKMSGRLIQPFTNSAEQLHSTSLWSRELDVGPDDICNQHDKPGLAAL